MDSAIKNLQNIKQLISQRRIKALLIGSAVLVTLVVLQVSKQPQSPAMVELFVECKLRNSDLNRIQVALGKAGQRDYQIIGHRLLVPQRQHAEYIQALIDHDAIPLHLREGEKTTSLGNPFLTHSQQVSLQREQRKQKLQNLITLLPFVDQAWLEMDDPADRTAFRQHTQSAVVSIRPVQQQPLLEPQIVTIREMVAGAISGIHPEQVVVIDLDSGNAYRGAIEAAPLEQKWIAQRANFARQKWLESQLKEALDGQAGLSISVLLTSFIANESGNGDKITRQDIRSPDGSTLELEFLYGANGQVSLSDPQPTEESDPGIPRHGERLAGDQSETQTPAIQQVTFISQEMLQTPDRQSDRQSDRQLETRIPLGRPRFQILIEVPARLLIQTGGTSSLGTPLPESFRWGSGISQPELNLKFELYRNYLMSRIRPILELHEEELPHSVDIQLVGQEEVLRDWRKTVQQWLTSHWQSVLILLTGLVLIGLIGRKPAANRSADSGPSPAPWLSADGDQLAARAESAERVVADEETEAVKARLSKLIETDPQTAARVIEKWIRDSA
jgi:hypothetical protein